VAVGDVQETLQRVAGNPAVQIHVLGDPVPSPASAPREDVTHAVADGIARIQPGTPVIPYMAPYGTDGKEVRRAGIPTYGVMGLFMKDSDQFAHGLNERIPVRPFYDALEFWHVVITELSRQGMTP